MIGVYITFRRDTITSYIAVTLEKMLGAKGIEGKTGNDLLRKGDFSKEAEQIIKDSQNIIVILTPNTWGRADDNSCWMTKEIELALSLNKNIIPLVTRDFVWPKVLPKKIEKLKYYNCLVIDSEKISDIEEKLLSLLIGLPSKKDYIFISYCHKDSNQVLPVINRLIDENYNVWYDEGIDPGTEWDKNIAQHIDNCGYFIAFMSKNYLASSNCKDELNFARDREKKRFLVYIEKTELPIEMQMRLSRIQNIHKYTYEKEETFFEKLFRAEGLAQFKE